MTTDPQQIILDKLDAINMIKQHFTYQTKNLINGKLYIGQHSTVDIEDGYLGSGSDLKKDIEKYGKENFAKEILSFFDTKEEAMEEERYLITDEWVADPNTYNMQRGGSTLIAWNHPNNTRGLERHYFTLLGKDFKTNKEASEHFKVSPKTIQRWKKHTPDSAFKYGRIEKV